MLNMKLKIETKTSLIEKSFVKIQTNQIKELGPKWTVLKAKDMTKVDDRMAQSGRFGVQSGRLGVQSGRLQCYSRSSLRSLHLSSNGRPL